jgi:serralysin
MFRRSVRFLLLLAAVAATTSMTAVAYADYYPPTELLGDGGPVIPLKNAAMIVITPGGYRYIAGQQNSHLTITVADGKLLYVDTGTAELRHIPWSCSRRSVPKGISALCKVPAKYDDGNRMFLEVWPRLGDDVVDGSTLAAMFRLWVLADAGSDTVYGGDGDDFVNGAQDDDKAWGGAGNDWIRTGIGNDELWGGTGDDKLVGLDGRDKIHGGDGNDSVGGGSGNDVLWAGAGQDAVACGGGYDYAYIDESDRTSECESLTG